LNNYSEASPQINEAAQCLLERSGNPDFAGMPVVAKRTFPLSEREMLVEDPVFSGYKKYAFSIQYLSEA